MDSQRRGRRQVDIFNFSFLDILACVIGLLIFILTIVVISGGRPATAVSSDLALAEHELHDAASAATSTAERRSRAEYLLSQRSIAVIDPKAAADLLRGQIRMLSEETDNLSEATARSNAELRAVRQKLQSIAPTVNSDSDMVAAQAEAQSLDERSSLMAAKITSVKERAKQPRQEVAFYVPRVRESSRHQRWAEISGDKLWCIESSDYRTTALNLESTRYDRLPGAAGTSISALLKGRIEPPDLLTNADPHTIVIQILLRTNGYSAFRQFREWAWTKGYAVNWVPSDADEPIVLTNSSQNFEQ